MAKVRVYELAKELNMESKILVEKLKTGGMGIKNYMSTLDEEAVVRARDIVTGTVSEIVEEKRIKPTIIRRRKKRIKVGVKKPAAEPAREEEPLVEPVKPVEPPEMEMPKEVEPVPQEVEKEIQEVEERIELKEVSKEKI